MFWQRVSRMVHTSKRSVRHGDHFASYLWGTPYVELAPTQNIRNTCRHLPNPFLLCVSMCVSVS